MSKSNILLALTLVLFVFLQSCKNSPTEVSENLNPDNSYTPLVVGTESQYYNSSGLRLTTKIAGKATREDGQEVFIEQIRSRHESTFQYSYLFIKDGYYYSTSLIKTGSSDNPYGENRLAKPNLQDGESWYVNQNVADSIKSLATSEFIGEMTTNAGTFKDVYKVHFVYNSKHDTSDVYYAKGIGQIAIGSNSDIFYLGYLKIGDKKYGNQFTE